MPVNTRIPGAGLTPACYQVPFGVSNHLALAAKLLQVELQRACGVQQQAYLA